ncbi:MAG: glycosyltransferase family 4 protein [Caldilineaceae bacterium]|nr:glycosyltransferase family 4 protein [Caldilineaceae bacterium]
MTGATLRVCYFGTYRSEYSRNRILMEGLRRNGVQVIECHEQLWGGIEDRVETVESGWKHPGFWWRVATVYARLIRRYWQVRGSYDVLVVGYPGQLDVFLARLLTWLDGKPLAWDIFMSIYLIALERGLDKKSRLGVGLLRRLEWLACRLPDHLIMDTAAYAAWFEKTHGVAASRFGLVPTGADDRLFYPAPPSANKSDRFTVLYYGTFIPNHGVQTIIEAAVLLADDPSLHFVLIGDGPDRPAAAALAAEKNLTNVTFIGWLQPEEVRQHIADADICLGVFGTTPQSLMTVQNKIYECMAMGKPVLTGEGPAVMENFRHKEHLYFCKRQSPGALVEAIRALHGDPRLRQEMAEQGNALFRQGYGLGPVGKRARSILERLRRP